MNYKINQLVYVNPESEWVKQNLYKFQYNAEKDYIITETSDSDSLTIKLHYNKEFEIIAFYSDFDSFAKLYSKKDNATITVFKKRLGKDFLLKPINYNKYWAQLNA